MKPIVTEVWGFSKKTCICFMSVSPITVTDIDSLALGASITMRSQTSSLLAADSRVAQAGAAACDTQAERFACQVFSSTNRFWGSQINGYTEPGLRFFTDRNTSGCGAAQSAMGPFYCPADQRIYLDTAFFGELRDRFGAAGDAAQAYVVAHEVGHHIQTITGTSDQVRRAQQRASQAEGNALQVRMELQADCYAGVWAASERASLDQGDLEEGLRAAAAIGDDTLQRAAQGVVVPESFTHGTSAQRQRALTQGFQSGDPASCDSFMQGV